MFAGNTGDPAAFVQAAEVVRDRFGLTRIVMVGDGDMITTGRIDALKELDDGMGWVTALRAPAIKKLAAEDGPLQMSLFDQQDLAEITSPDYPAERLIVGRNPPLAAERARKRGELLDATHALLDEIAARAERGTLAGVGDIGVAVGKVINRYRVGKHFEVTITPASLTVQRKQDQIGAEAALDGIYVLRTSVPASQLDAPGVVSAYKNLAHVERDFRIVEADDLDLRPIYHQPEDRVKADVLICVLACYLVWHLRRAWAPLAFADEHPPQRGDPVTAAQRSPEAQAKASHQRDECGRLYRSFGGLLEHLATLTRNQVRFAGTNTEIPMLAETTPHQRHAFDLIGASIPLTLK